MKFISPVQEIIRARKSVRSYTDDPIGLHEKDILEQLMTALKTDRFRFVMIDFAFEENTKVGTYGMVRGASAYLVGIMKRTCAIDPYVSFDFGYNFEKIILKATDLGLSTCWLAGTFNAKDVEKLVSLGADEQIVIVSPIGHSAEAGLREKLTRFLSKADNRKPWKELFFIDDLTTPLVASEAGSYADVLEMVRLAPSARNVQPWRIVRKKDRFDFYAFKAMSKKSTVPRLNLTYNDMGIAKAHFELAATELGLKGHWDFESGHMEVMDDLKPIGSWVCELNE